MKALSPALLGLVLLASVTGAEAGLVVAQETKLTLAGDGKSYAMFGNAVALGPNLLLAGDILGTVKVFARDGTAWSHDQVLLPPDADHAVSFGRAIALDDDVAVIAARTPTAYVFRRTDGNWSLEAALVANPTHPEWCSGAVAVSASTIVVGCMDESVAGGSGAVHVFRRDGTSGAWSEVKRLTPPDFRSRNFGAAVAVDGDTILVGDPGYQYTAARQGAAHVYRWSGSDYSLEKSFIDPDLAAGTRDDFGQSVALRGGFAAISAPSATVGTQDDAGAVYVYQRTEMPKGTTWSSMGRLTASDSATVTGWGTAVGIDLVILRTGVIAGRLVVAGPNHGSGGAGYIFGQTGSTWSEQARVVGPYRGQGNAGASIAVSGNAVAVGVPMADAREGVLRAVGEVQLFRQSGATWPQESTLTGDSGAAYDMAGSLLAASGDTLAVLAPLDVGAAGPSVGSAHVFERVGRNWKLQADIAPRSGQPDSFGGGIALDGDRMILPLNLGSSSSIEVYERMAGTRNRRTTLTDPATDVSLGPAVALSGDTIVAEAYSSSASTPAPHLDVFGNAGGTWVHLAKLCDIASANQCPRDIRDADEFGRALALEGDTLLAGAPSDAVSGIRQGTVFVFGRRRGRWLTPTKLSANDGAAGDLFGLAVALSRNGSRAVVGAPHAASGAVTGAGAAYVFEKIGGAWLQTYKLIGPPVDGGRFGASVAIEGDAILVGAPGKDPGNASDPGAAHLYVRSGDGWNEKAIVVPADSVAGDEVGGGVAMAGETLFVGAPMDDNTTGSRSGAIYVYLPERDFGDALGKHFPTLLEDDGARHWLDDSGPRIGKALDAEIDGQPSVGAIGDDTAGESDEDGVTFGKMVPGRPGSARIVLSAPAGIAVLDAWIDFNGDRDWNDAGERIASAKVLPHGATALTFDVPSTAKIGTTIARFRLSSNGTPRVDGFATDGEVHDQRVKIGAP